MEIWLSIKERSLQEYSREGSCIYRAHEGEGGVLADVPVIAGLNRVRTEALQTANIKHWSNNLYNDDIFDTF